MVGMKYSEYGRSPKIKEVKMDLLPGTILSLFVPDSYDHVELRMSDAITDNTEISGTLNCNELNTFIRVLVQIRNMLEEGE